MDPGVAIVTDDVRGNCLQPWFDWLERAIGLEIQRLRTRYELSLDEFRGLYISDEQVDGLIERRNVRDTERPALPDLNGKLAWIQRRFGLSRAQCGCLFLALAPELDLKFATLYAYLNNDAGAKFATVDLALRLLDLDASALLPNANVLRLGLLVPFPPKTGAPWRTTPFALSAPALEFFANPEEPRSTGRTSGPASVLIESQPGALVIQTRNGCEAESIAFQIASELGLGFVTFDPSEGLDRMGLRAMLTSSALYFPESSFQLENGDQPSAEAVALLRRALELEVPAIYAVSRSSPWRRIFDGCKFEVLSVEPPGAEARSQIWGDEIDLAGKSASEQDLTALGRAYILYPPQIARAVAYAVRRAPDEPILDYPVLVEAARQQGTTSLQELGFKETTSLTWDDLVHPDATRQRLKEVESAILTRETVFENWSMKRSSMGRTSLRVLFSGASGTGKTVTASVMASEVGLDLYRIDVSAVVSKYIGETERNLERVFRAAEGSNAIIFFDEADALFGKRTEIKDAHDRYANIEVSYLLQRMEQYDGVMILSTNLSKNIDEAFSRRIHFSVDFPMPAECERKRLWDLSLPLGAPRGEDIDLDFMAAQFALAGGDIRNVALDAAFLAAGEASDIEMRHLIRAMARQRLKQGKLPSPSEFRHYFRYAAVTGDTLKRGRGT